MEVVLEKKNVHWTLLVGSEANEVCYEFEQYGVQIGPRTVCRRQIPERTHLGCTNRTHDEIKNWAQKFDRNNRYNVLGTDFGGKNCQDFVVECCEFIGISPSQLPWRNVRQAEAAIGGALVVGALAIGAKLLSGLVNNGAAQRQQQPQRPYMPNANMTPHNNGQLTLLHNAKFQPGPIGFTANWVSCLVTSVSPGGQAAHQGVEVGMAFDSIDGQPFSLPLLDQYIAGGREYTMTFKKSTCGLGAFQATYGLQHEQQSQSYYADNPTDSNDVRLEGESSRDERRTKAALCWAPW